MNMQNKNMVALQHEITVRAAAASDAATLVAIGQDGFTAVHQSAAPQDKLRGFLADSWNETVLAEMIANPDIQLMVAEVGSELVGLVCLNPTQAPSYLRNVRPVELYSVYVQHEWSGQGVGSQLMRHSLRQAAALGYGVCWLRVWQGNKSAIHFYQRWGFAIVAADAYAIGDTTVPLWLMVHSLSQETART